jgi:hypothetical protein
MTTLISHDLPKLETVCHAIAGRLERLTRLRCRGIISEPTFVDFVLKIEAEDVRPHGLTLTASNTIDDWTVFQIKINGANEPCAAFEFLPETGEFRRSVHTHCAEQSACACA